MFVRNKAQAPKRQRNVLESHTLLQKGCVTDSQLAITWIKIGAGCSRKPHNHDPDQCSVFLGRDIMRVESEQSQEGPGAMVHIPANAVHAIANVGDGPLISISASHSRF